MSLSVETRRRDWEVKAAQWLKSTIWVAIGLGLSVLWYRTVTHIDDRLPPALAELSKLGVLFGGLVLSLIEWLRRYGQESRETSIADEVPTLGNPVLQRIGKAGSKPSVAENTAARVGRGLFIIFVAALTIAALVHYRLSEVVIGLSIGLAEVLLPLAVVSAAAHAVRTARDRMQPTT